MGEPLLDVTDLHVRFGEASAVRGVDLRMSPGEVVGLVGESGAGKSAFVCGVVGLLPRGATMTGSVRLDRTELVGLDDRAVSALRGPGVAMVFQDPLSVLNPLRRVGTLVAEPLHLHDRSLSRHGAATRVDELFHLVGLPSGAQQAFAHELSGGMRQRVGIAVAMACSPRLLVADEPTTSLDVTVQAQVLDVLDTARQASGAGLLLVSHDLGVVAGWADRVAVMYGGRIVEQAQADDLFASPQMPYTTGLLRAVPDPREARRLVPVPGDPPVAAYLAPGCAFAPRCPAAQRRCTRTDPPLAPLGTDDTSHLVACWRTGEIGDDVFAVPPPREPQRPAPGEPVLEIRDLHVTHRLDAGVWRRGRRGQVVAVDDVSVTVRRGEIVALVGESGAGKTSTVEHIFDGTPSPGTVRVLGQDLAQAARPERRRLRRTVQLVAQDATDALNPRMTVGAAIAEPLVLARVPRPERHDRVAEALTTVGLHGSDATAYPHQLSGGQRRRVTVARALVTNPELVVLDEPVAGLDVSVAAGLLELLADLRDTRGLTALVVTHDLAVVRHLADRVAVMAVGRLVEEASTEALFTAPTHPYTRALLAAVPVPDPTAPRPAASFAPDTEWTTPTTTGCRLAPRCPLFANADPDQQTLCRTQPPSLVATHDPTRTVACHWCSTPPDDLVQPPQDQST
ncbi:MAG: ABC transporter ATP-binding protein [Micrococcales bacterium]|nr:ABC transporter ATP-binding protein [Micrococcales bacterium]MCL2668974.1 ABC transporter ATP-binding protein [Micrococcales bacterium]